MKPIFKYHTIILTITVSLMYFLFLFVFNIRNSIPEIPKPLELLLAILLSVGVYKLISSLLNLVLSHFYCVKKFIQGNEYMHGTWVGFFSNSNGERINYVEYFEQDLEQLTINGTAYTEEGKFHAQWNSEPATLEARKGRLIYSYTADVLSREVTRQGLGVFQFIRLNLNKPPHELKGYIVDSDQAKRLPSHEKKISDISLPIAEALAIAKEYNG